MSAIFTLFEGLDRAGPGDRDSVAWAFGAARTRPDAVVLDAGCGPGADVAALLAHVPQGRVVAVDLHPGFVARVMRHPGVRAEVADMADPPDGPFDLIWSAGSIYNLGVTEGLRAWRRHLAPGGRVVFSQIGWRTAPCGAAQAFWAEEYPRMTDAAGIHDQVAAAGWRVLADRWLPWSAWSAYYTPLADRVAALGADADPDMRACLALFAREIAVWRAQGDDYGYLQVVCEVV